METSITSDGILTIKIDLKKGAHSSASGKMQLLNDVPSGWQILGNYQGTDIKGSLNIGHK